MPVILIKSMNGFFNEKRHADTTMQTNVCFDNLFGISLAFRLEQV